MRPSQKSILSHINLTKAQKRVVRAICAKQIETLQELLSPDDVDALLYACNNDLEISEVNDTLLDTHQIFLDLEKNPETLPTLDENRLEVFKEILMHLPSLHKYPKARKKLWKVVNLLQDTQDMVELKLLNNN